jgi:hypothetical protein
VSTLGDAAWREVQTPTYARCRLEAGVVSVDGATYWVAEGSEDRIMSFDLETERVSCTQPLPMPARPVRHLTQVNRKLSIATPSYGDPSNGYRGIQVILDLQISPAPLSTLVI